MPLPFSILAIVVAVVLLLVSAQLLKRRADSTPLKKRDDLDIEANTGGGSGTPTSRPSSPATISALGGGASVAARRRNEPNPSNWSDVTDSAVFQSIPLKPYIPQGSAASRVLSSSAALGFVPGFRPIKVQAPQEYSSKDGDPMQRFLQSGRGGSMDDTSNPAAISPYLDFSLAPGSGSGSGGPVNGVPSSVNLSFNEPPSSQIRPITGPESLLVAPQRNPLVNIARLRYVEVQRDKPLHWKAPPPQSSSGRHSPGPIFYANVPAAASSPATPAHRRTPSPVPPLPLYVISSRGSPLHSAQQQQQHRANLFGATPPGALFFFNGSGGGGGGGGARVSNDEEALDATAQAPPSPLPYIDGVSVKRGGGSSPQLLAAENWGTPASPQIMNAAPPYWQATPPPAADGRVRVSPPPVELPLLAGPPIFGHSPEAQLYAANAQALTQKRDANVTAANAAASEPRVPSAAHFEIAFESLQLGRLIGQGAFGRVYKARWHGSAVAVKMLICQTLKDDVVVDFRAEVSVLSALRHPNILLFMGACTIAPHYCIVTEFLSRGSVWGLLHDPPPAPATGAGASAPGGRASPTHGAGKPPGRTTPSAAAASAPSPPALTRGQSGGFVVPPPPELLDQRLVLRMALDVARGMVRT